MCYWKTSIDLHSTVVVAQWCFILSEKQSNILYFALPFLLSLLFEHSSYWQHSRRQQVIMGKQSFCTFGVKSSTNLSLSQEFGAAKPWQQHTQKHHNRIQCLPSTHTIYRDCRGKQSQKKKKYSRHTENKQREKEGYRDREANRLALYASQTVGGKGLKFWRIGQPETLLLYFHQFIHIC